MQAVQLNFQYFDCKIVNDGVLRCESLSTIMIRMFVLSMPMRRLGIKKKKLIIKRNDSYIYITRNGNSKRMMRLMVMDDDESDNNDAMDIDVDCDTHRGSEPDSDQDSTGNQLSH